jgi:glucose-6-phosphate isomerase
VSSSGESGELLLELTVADAGQLAGTVAELVDDRVASRITGQDATLWGSEAESEAAIRLAWTTLHETSRPLIDRIETLRGQLRDEGLDHVVLAGMGGSSLAPEVICKTAGVELVTLDTTDPGQVAAALADRLDRTVLVVSSKSGGTVETDSHRRAYEQAFTEHGIDPKQRIVVVTDPGSPLQQVAEQAGYRAVFLADPHVGGRYSALTAFGLVPAGLAGADIGGLLDDAAAAGPALAADDPDNPGLRLGALLGLAQNAGSDKVVFADLGSGIDGFGDWVEQLIAESTGKQGRGLLPVVVEGPSAPGFADARTDAILVRLTGPDGAGQVSPPPSGWAAATAGPLGAQMLLWEYATAIAGRIIGINPFDQPNVEEAKKQARALLDVPDDQAAAQPDFTEGAVQLSGENLDLTGVTDLAGALAALFGAAPDLGYVSIQAYLDRLADDTALDLRHAVAERTGLQTTFGWGPRFLHSTGQYHKGGHPNGVFLQITGEAARDLPVPGRPYSFASLQRAQAAGDATVLAAKGRPVLHLHLTDRGAGLAQLLKAC